MLKKTTALILSFVMLLSLAACGKKKTNSELFFEEKSSFFDSSYYEYNLKGPESISVYGKIDAESKNMTINITQESMEPISMLLNGNELYVSLKSVIDFVNTAYSEDEQMLIISDTLNTRYSDYKYLSLRISESDIWENMMNIHDAIPEGDMSWLYELVKITIDNIYENVTDEVVEFNKENKTYTATIDKQIVNDALTAISNSQNIKDLVLELSEEGIVAEDFNLDITPSTLKITVSKNLYECKTDDMVLSVTHGESFNIPDDLENSYSIDQAIDEPMTMSVDIELNDGNAIDTEFEVPAETTLFENAEDDSVYGLISYNPDDFKDIFIKTLTPIGFEETSSTSDSIEMSYESEQKYKYLVSFKNNTVTIRMETDSDYLSNFSDEFSDCAIPILGLKFDKYSMYSNLQETYSEAKNIFDNTKQKIYTKTGTINETKIQYDIRNIDNVTTISIETSRKLPKT